VALPAAKINRGRTSGYAVPRERWPEFAADKNDGASTTALMEKYEISRNTVFTTVRRIEAAAL
jgi:Mor family transcriptional regulator